MIDATTYILSHMIATCIMMHMIDITILSSIACFLHHTTVPIEYITSSIIKIITLISNIVLSIYPFQHTPTITVGNAHHS